MEELKDILERKDLEEEQHKDVSCFHDAHECHECGRLCFFNNDAYERGRKAYPSVGHRVICSECFCR